MASRNRRPHRAQPFQVVDSRFVVHAHPFVSNGLLQFRCQAFERCVGGSVPVGQRRVIGTRIHVEKWARELFLELHAKEPEHV